jgi:hypothetical protein
MKTLVCAAAAVAMAVGLARAQEPKPVPKDSARVSVPGCSKGYIFTVAARSTNEAGSNYDIPEGTHLRMNGAKKLINEIKAHEGQMLQLTGIMKIDQLPTGGVNLGGGVRVGAGAPVGGMPMPGGGQNFIDVEGYRTVPDKSCPSR